MGFNDKNSVSLEMTFWRERDGSIRLAIPGFDRPAIIKDDPLRPSGHPKLFRILSERLGALPPPRESLGRWRLYEP
jgi:hypothetical protein